jgi:DNA helicase-2/ATP-dependent DNA helicase PcrA
LDDLVREAAWRLGHDSELARAWRGRFVQVLVDEYQDVNPAQIALLLALSGAETQFTAIGDPDQAIYGFRGADRKLIAGFGRSFPGATVMSLTRNYRSAKPIVNLAQALMAQNFDPARPRLIPTQGGGGWPVLCEQATAEAEADWVARRIVDLLGGVDSRQTEAVAYMGGPHYGAADIAVLYRLHVQAPLLKRALEMAGVPVQVASREPLAETDPLDFKTQRVSLLTMHAAKGLEFPVVFLVGLEEGLLPYQPPERPPADLDEERRLLFVAITRARQRLYLCRARQRFLFGQVRRPEPSPFIRDLDDSLWETEKPAARRRRIRQLGLFVD